MKDISTSILKVRATRPEFVSVGSILVAEPFLSESYFNHGVITLVDYTSADGALGLVMNIPTGHTLDCYIEGVDSSTEVPVYCGGPVGEDRMVFMHTLGESVFPGAKEFLPGLYLGGDFSAAVDYVNAGCPLEGRLRFFIGYSGWGATQLDSELDDAVWAVAGTPCDRSCLLSGTGDSYWHKFVQRMGDNYRPWRLFPRNIRDN